MGYEQRNGFDDLWMLFGCILYLMIVSIAWALHGVGRPFVRMFGGSGAAARWDEAFMVD